ncbi:MAG: class I SAM-dependent methyltransferase [Janthinobacterium lividum]
MSAAPSTWIVRWQHLLAAGGSVLDVACGSGRHLGWLQARGHRVTGVDRSPEALSALTSFAAAGAEIVGVDIESGLWPFEGRAFDAVIVTNYLWRPRLPDIVAALAPGGVLLYETFAAGNASVGRPARADFLLQPGELLATCGGLHVVAYENGFLDAPARFVQRIVAVRPNGAPGETSTPPRFALDPGQARSQFPPM